MELDDPFQTFAPLPPFFSSSLTPKFFPCFSSPPLAPLLRALREALEPRFSNSESMFLKCSDTRELHFPANRSLAGDSLLDDEREAAPVQNVLAPPPQPPDDDDSCCLRDAKVIKLPFLNVYVIKVFPIVCSMEGGVRVLFDAKVVN
jgi:hypothetical protein